MAGAAAEPPWEPPPCPAVETRRRPEPGGVVPARAGARRARARSPGMRLTVGVDGTAGRHMDLAPESFASGPAGGLVLVGEDDGAVSRLSLAGPGARLLDGDRR